MIEGLPGDQGEYIAARLAVADDPDSVAEHWVKHDYTMFNTCNGLGYVKDFPQITAPRPRFLQRQVQTE